MGSRGAVPLWAVIFHGGHYRLGQYITRTGAQGAVKRCVTVVCLQHGAGLVQDRFTGCYCFDGHGFLLIVATSVVVAVVVVFSF